MELPEFKRKINYKDSILFLGSCFSENIYAKLKELNFDVIPSPNGIVFNSFSVAQPLLQVLSNQLYSEDSLVHHNGLWHGWNHHGSYSHENLNTCLNRMNRDLTNFKNMLSHASYLFITLGTSFVYNHKNRDFPVANCHKIPQDQFEKKCIDMDTQRQFWNKLLEQLNQKYPNIRFVFTVSPVKHLRDGVSENVLSKSILIQLCHRLKNDHSFVDYFPAFELVSEDLRDYRFYELDGAHPNDIAIDYVFEKLLDSMMDDISKQYIEDCNNFLKFKNHKIINANEEQKQKHGHQLNSMMTTLLDKYGKKFI